MKTTTVPAIAFLAILAAFAVLPLSLPVATAALAVVGLAWIVSTDYATSPLPLRKDAGIVQVTVSSAVALEFRQAA